MEQIGERRRYARFKVPFHSVYASLRHSLFRRSTMGEIFEASIGGFAFRYVGDEPLPFNASRLDIYSTNGTSLLKKIRARPVWDSVAPDPSLLKDMTSRCCGVQLMGLTDEQELRLRYFILTHTEADAEA